MGKEEGGGTQSVAPKHTYSLFPASACKQLSLKARRTTMEAASDRLFKIVSVEKTTCRSSLLFEAGCSKKKTMSTTQRQEASGTEGGQREEEQARELRSWAEGGRGKKAKLDS